MLVILLVFLKQRDPSNEEVFSSILDPLLPCPAKLSRMITAKSNPNYSMSAIFWWLICLCLLPSSGKNLKSLISILFRFVKHKLN